MSRQTAGDKGEEGGDDVKSAWPLCLGLHTRYNGQYKGTLSRKMEQTPKIGLSSDWGLKFDPMKLESLVTVYHPWHGEYVLEFCTHRPSNQGSRGYLKRRIRGSKVKPMTGVKS